MMQFRKACVVLIAGLLAAAPMASFAQLQPNGGDKPGSQQSPNPEGGTVYSGLTPVTTGFGPSAGFDRSAATLRYGTDHGYAENRADTAWRRGDRRTACRWAKEARDRPGWTNERTTGKAQQYCEGDKSDSDSQSSAGA
jgi:hypothetical protein